MNPSSPLSLSFPLRHLSYRTSVYSDLLLKGTCTVYRYTLARPRAVPDRIMNAGARESRAVSRAPMRSPDHARAWIDLAVRTKLRTGLCHFVSFARGHQYCRALEEFTRLCLAAAAAAPRLWPSASAHSNGSWYPQAVSLDCSRAQMKTKTPSAGCCRLSLVLCFLRRQPSVACVTRQSCMG